jgi:hypothetical protein
MPSMFSSKSVFAWPSRPCTAVPLTHPLSKVPLHTWGQLARMSHTRSDPTMLPNSDLTALDPEILDHWSHVTRLDSNTDVDGNRTWRLGPWGKRNCRFFAIQMGITVGGCQWPRVCEPKNLRPVSQKPGKVLGFLETIRNLTTNMTFWLMSPLK